MESLSAALASLHPNAMTAKLDHAQGLPLGEDALELSFAVRQPIEHAMRKRRAAAAPSPLRRTCLLSSGGAR